MSQGRRTENLLDLAESLVDYALSNGADEVEVSIQEGNEFNVDVRMGEIENLLESGSKHLAFRLIKDKKTAYAGSSDLSREVLNGLILSALKRVAYTHRDEFSGLPDTQNVSVDPAPLRLYDPTIQELESKEKIQLALRTEKAALADRRITNSHGSSFETREIHTFITNSKGFSGTSSDTFFSLGVGLQAGDPDNKVEGYWSTTDRFFAELETPEEVALKAMKRTVRQLNPRKISTEKVPVIFEPSMTAWLMGFLFGCVTGTSVYQKTTFLADSLGKAIGNPRINVFDDGLMPGKLGTSPFDSEGVPSRRNQVVKKGVLQSFLLNTYTARKLGKTTTGNASGSGVGPSNFYLEAGPEDPEDIRRSLDRGLILTRTIGHGLNPVTGDISRGAFGLWVEKGEIIFPVSEVTISGNLGAILHDIEQVGNDLEFRSSVCGPTIRIAELTVAGQ
jgi:PmbA protein